MNDIFIFTIGLFVGVFIALFAARWLLLAVTTPAELPADDPTWQRWDVCTVYVQPEVSLLPQGEIKDV